MAQPTLPNASRAGVDRRKFANYSMDPDADNEGKWEAWQALGYDVHKGREVATDDVTRQIQAQLPTAPASSGPRTEWGQKYHTSFLIVGPNGKRGTLETTWQVDHGADTPRILTNWLKVHREDRE